MGTGTDDLRARNYQCAQQDFAKASASFREEMGRPAAGGGPIPAPQVNLAFSLAQEGYALAKLGKRGLASEKWIQAAQLSVPPAYERSETTQRADDLFARHRYHEALAAYRDFIFLSNGGSRLNPGEFENGAAAKIKNSLTLAVNGNYGAAFRELKGAPPSQAASFLSGQMASILNKRGAAYDAYLEELVAYLSLPALPPGPMYGTVFDRPTLLRLVQLSRPNH